MSYCALAVAAILQAEMPEMAVRTTRFTRGLNDVTPGEPTIVVSDGGAQGFTVSVYPTDADDIDGLNADVLRAASEPVHFPGNDAEYQLPTDLFLIHGRTATLLDDDGMPVGARLNFTTLLHSGDLGIAA